MTTNQDRLRELVAKWRKYDAYADGAWQGVRTCADELESALAAVPEVAGGAAFPRPCGLCPGQIESKEDFDWHGLGNCVPICERCDGSGIEPSEAPKYEQLFHRVMGWLRNTKMPHGLCEPRERKACTHCNAVEELDKMLAEYKGPRIIAQADQRADAPVPASVTDAGFEVGRNTPSSNKSMPPRESLGLAEVSRRATSIPETGVPDAPVQAGAHKHLIERMDGALRNAVGMLEAYQKLIPDARNELEIRLAKEIIDSAELSIALAERTASPPAGARESFPAEFILRLTKLSEHARTCALMNGKYFASALDVILLWAEGETFDLPSAGPAASTPAGARRFGAWDKGLSGDTGTTPGPAASDGAGVRELTLNEAADFVDHYLDDGGTVFSMANVANGIRALAALPSQPAKET